MFINGPFILHGIWGDGDFTTDAWMIWRRDTLCGSGGESCYTDEHCHDEGGYSLYSIITRAKHHRFQLRLTSGAFRSL